MKLCHWLWQLKKLLTKGFWGVPATEYSPLNFMKLINIIFLLCLFLYPITTPCPYKFHVIPTSTAVKIATREGFFHKETLPARYHNPGSLVYNHQRNAKRGGYNHFAIFLTDEDGWRALHLNLHYLRSRHIQVNTVWTYLPNESLNKY